MKFTDLMCKKSSWKELRKAFVSQGTQNGNYCCCSHCCCYCSWCWWVGRVFANGLWDLGSILGRVILKTLKMVLDTSLLNTQQYKVHIKDKVEQSRERNRALLLHRGVVAIDKGAFWSPSTTVANLLTVVSPLLFVRKKYCIQREEKACKEPKSESTLF